MNQIEAIMSYLNSDDPSLRQWAIRKAGHIGTAEADAIVAAHLHGDDPTTRYAAIEVITDELRVLSINREEAISTLLKLLTDPNERAIGLIIEALFRMNFSDYQRLIDLLLREPRPDATAELSDLMIDTDYRAVEEHTSRLLVKALHDDDEIVRSQAVCIAKYVLGHWRHFQLPTDIGEAMVPLLSSEDGEVRACAAVLLEYTSADIAVKPLLKALNDESIKVRLSAIYSLGQHGYTSAVEPIFQLGLSHEDADVRFMAAKALSVLAPSRFVELVAMGTVNSLNDDHYGTIASALQHMGGKGIPKENIANAMTKLWESNQLT